MNRGLFFRTILCIFIFGFCLYCYIDMQNEITQLRISLPKLASEVQRIEEENMRLAYEIEQFESPENLMKLSLNDEFAHLKHPMQKEIIALKQASPIGHDEKAPAAPRRAKSTITFASGSH